MGLFDGVSWQNPLGTGGSSPGGLLNALSGRMGNFFGQNMTPSQDFMNFSGLNSLQTGYHTPWGPTDSKGLAGAFNPVEIIPGLHNLQDSSYAGMFGDKPTPPSLDKFNQNNYKTSDYSDLLNAGKNQIAENLAQNQNELLARQAGQGALLSGSTGLGLQGALNASNNSNQQLANQIGQMQYNDAYSQYLAQQQAKMNNYQNELNKYNTNQQNLSSSLGTGAALLARL